MADRDTRMSPFGWWSLGLGVVSLLPCMFIYFVPAVSAVVAGGLTIRHVHRWPKTFHGVGLGWVGIVMGVLSIALGLTAWVLRARAEYA